MTSAVPAHVEKENDMTEEPMSAMRMDRDRWRQVAEERNDVAKRAASMQDHISGLEDQLARAEDYRQIISADRDSLSWALYRISEQHQQRSGVCGTCVNEDDNPAAWPCPTAAIVEDLEQEQRAWGTS